MAIQWLIGYLWLLCCSPSIFRSLCVKMLLRRRRRRKKKKEKKKKKGKKNQEVEEEIEIIPDPYADCMILKFMVSDQKIYTM